MPRVIQERLFDEPDGGPGRLGKHCPSCGRWRQRSRFYRKPTAADGRHFECKECMNRRSVAWRTRNPEKARAANREAAQRRRDAGKTLDTELRTKYGITAADYRRLAALQDGRCAICRQAPAEVMSTAIRRLGVDHCHVTGVVRGLLCIPCNSALGMFDESPERLEAAADYVRRAGVPDHRGAM